ncbi:MAG: FISUMP domain-containing protein [Bacteroidales bacterium]
MSNKLTQKFQGGFMSFICSIGFHSWEGCTCSKCGKKRDLHHQYENNDCGTCIKCGAIHDENHDWSKDCERCTKCGKTRSNHHNWLINCEKCSKCGKTRSDHHQYVNGMCSICGQGNFTDPRDGKIYRVIRIGNQIMMEDNLAFKPETGNYWAYDNEELNIAKYGYLYDWETAKNVAPKGWHLPTKAEWETLYMTLGNNANSVYDKAKVGGLGGFNGLLGGWRYAHGEFNSVGASGYFWSKTSESDEHASYFKLGAYSKHAEFGKGKTNVGMSVRLFKD